MSQTTTTGNRAEDAAAVYLSQNGFSILERNWRTRWCEIDIVAKRGQVLYFVEVKYRSNSAQGSGLAYITPSKQKQMRFAAEFWVASNGFGGDYELAALEVGGVDFDVTEFVESLT
jgi:uncharacterized protein (TIGR00252 family)